MIIQEREEKEFDHGKLSKETSTLGFVLVKGDENNFGS